MTRFEEQLFQQTLDTHRRMFGPYVADRRVSDAERAVAAIAQEAGSLATDANVLDETGEES
jgi:hypothetical protein